MELPPFKEVGEPAPRAPQRQEPRQGLQTPPAPEDQSVDEGPGRVESLVVDALPWDDEEPTGRVLKKTPPPATALKVEPHKKARLEEETAKRPRKGEPARESGGASSSRRHTYMDLVERRVEKVQVGEDEMHHLDEVIDVETVKEDVDQFDTWDKKRSQSQMVCGVMSIEQNTTTTIVGGGTPC